MGEWVVVCTTELRIEMVCGDAMGEGQPHRQQRTPCSLTKSHARSAQQRRLLYMFDSRLREGDTATSDKADSPMVHKECS